MEVTNRPPINDQISQELALVGESSSLAQWGFSPESSTLRVRVFSDEASIVIKFEAFDRAGHAVVQQYLLVTPQLDRTGSHQNFLELQNIHKADAAMRTIKLSDRASSVLKFESSQTADEVPLWLVRPDVHDPLNEVAVEFLRGLSAENSSKCFAVEACDLFWSGALQSQSEGKASLAAFERNLDRFCPYQKFEDASIIAWSPVNATAVEAGFSDRKSLKDWIYSASQSGINPRSILAFYGAVSTLPSYLRSTWTNAAIKLAADYPVPDLGSPTLLHWLGPVPDDVLENIFSIHGASLQDLGTENDFLRWLQTERSLTVEGPAISDYYRFPLELFRDVPLGQVRVHGLEHDVPVIRFYSGGRATTSWLEVSRLSYVLLLSEKIKSRDQFEASFADKRIRTGVRRTIVVTFSLPGGYALTSPIGGVTSDQSDLTNYADLPEEQRKRLWDALVIARDEREKARLPTRNRRSPQKV